MRISGGKEPLDASSVHPEAYDLARRIVAACGRDIRSLMADPSALKGLEAKAFVDEKFGLPTVRDILAELEKPARDPRPSFKTASFADGVEDIKDLKPGMLLEGTVTNVTAFGAFVDIGVHQDGLVHISQLGSGRVAKTSDVVKDGDKVWVKLLGFDERGKVRLSMRVVDQETGAELEDTRPPREPRGDRGDRGDRGGRDRNDRDSSKDSGDTISVSFEDEFEAELSSDLGDLGPESGGRRRHR